MIVVVLKYRKIYFDNNILHILLQNELLTCLWYLNFWCTQRFRSGLEVQ